MVSVSDFTTKVVFFIQLLLQSLSDGDIFYISFSFSSINTSSTGSHFTSFNPINKLLFLNTTVLPFRLLLKLFQTRLIFLKFFQFQLLKQLTCDQHLGIQFGCYHHLIIMFSIYRITRLVSTKNFLTRIISSYLNS